MIYATYMLAVAAAADPRYDALMRRVEALEAKNAELQAQVDELNRQSGEAPTPTPAVVPPARVAGTPPAVPASVRAMQASSRQPWDHSYVGIHGGVRRMRNLDGEPGGTYYDYSAPRKAGEFAGIQIGKRWQTGRLVVGTEVSASLGLSDHLREVYEVRPPYTTPDMLLHHERDYSVAMKGDLGLALGNSLVYATAGVDIARLSSFNYAVATQQRTVQASPFWGLGLAQKLGSDLAVEAEGRYGYSRLGAYTDDVGIRLKVNYVFP